MLEMIKSLLTNAKTVGELRSALGLIKMAKPLIPMLVTGKSALEIYIRENPDDAIEAVDELLTLVEKHPKLAEAVINQYVSK